MSSYVVIRGARVLDARLRAAGHADVLIKDDTKVFEGYRWGRDGRGSTEAQV